VEIAKSGQGTVEAPQSPPIAPVDSRFYVTPGGQILAAPPGYYGHTAQNGRGLVLLPEGQRLGNNANIIRYGESTYNTQKAILDTIMIMGNR
jgi:hypothetical protein